LSTCLNRIEVVEQEDWWKRAKIWPFARKGQDFLQYSCNGNWCD